MSVYIKGLEMPNKGKRALWVVIHSDGTVEYDTGDYGWQTLRQSAVPVPPHGRLGDLDRLERMFADINNAPYSEFDGEDPFYSADDAAQIIRLAPTIIPADSAKEVERD